MHVSFTSHYVSINSLQEIHILLTMVHLHPTMYLLIRPLLYKLLDKDSYLHPTMYLLIRCFLEC